MEIKIPTATKIGILRDIDDNFNAILEVNLTEAQLDAIYLAINQRYALTDLEDYIDEDLRRDDEEGFAQLLSKLGLTVEEWDRRSYPESTQTKLRALADNLMEKRQAAISYIMSAETVKEYLDGEDACSNGEAEGDEEEDSSFTFNTAMEDITAYLRQQDAQYFTEKGTTREAVLGNNELLHDLAEEHMRCVIRYGTDREWSCKDACDSCPGISTETPDSQLKEGEIPDRGQQG